MICLPQTSKRTWWVPAETAAGDSRVGGGSARSLARLLPCDVSLASGSRVRVSWGLKLCLQWSPWFLSTWILRVCQTLDPQVGILRQEGDCGQLAQVPARDLSQSKPHNLLSSVWTMTAVQGHVNISMPAWRVDTGLSI